MSVEAVHERLIVDELIPTADRLVGAVGGVVSAGVDAVAVLENPERFPAASLSRP